MNIRRTEMVPWRVECICPKCTKGTMEYKFITTKGDTGPLHAHKCKQCGHEEWLKDRYPKTEYVSRT